MTLPPIPKDRNWSPETWRAGLDEAVRLIGDTKIKTWDDMARGVSGQWASVKAHATTLLDAGIVKPVVPELPEHLAVYAAMWGASRSTIMGDCDEGRSKQRLRFWPQLRESRHRPSNKERAMNDAVRFAPYFIVTAYLWTETSPKDHATTFHLWACFMIFGVTRFIVRALLEKKNG